MKKGKDRRVETSKLLVISLRTIHRPIQQRSRLLSCCAATCMTYIIAPGECRCFLLHGRMEHSMLRYPGPPPLDKLGDPGDEQWT